MMNKIYYLCHPWTYNPEESFNNAVRWTMALRKRGLTVFSPILHTHPYWKQIKTMYEGEDLDYLAAEDWLQWDKALMDELMAHDAPVCTKEIQCEDGCWDNGSKGSCHGYDSRLVLLVDLTALKPKSRVKGFFEIWKDTKYWKDIWASDGCRQEYDHAVKNHVRRLDLGAFLRGEEVEI